VNGGAALAVVLLTVVFVVERELLGAMRTRVAGHAVSGVTVVLLPLLLAFAFILGVRFARLV
jgi:hypothetical protein